MKLHASKGKVLGNMLIGVLLTLVGLWVMNDAFSTPNGALTLREQIFKYVMPLGVLGFIGIFFYWTWRLIDKRPILEVDEKGITFYHPNNGFFAWEDIQKVHLVEQKVGITRKVRMMVVVPRNISKTIDRYSGYARTRVQSSIFQCGGLPMVLSALKGNPMEIVGAIIEYSQQMIPSNATVPPIADYARPTSQPK